MDMPQDESGWLHLWATDPAAANLATMHLARTLPPHLAGALEAARLLRPYETVDCQEMAARALAALQQMQALDATHPLNGGNAKSAAPTEGAALEWPGLTGGQMVTLPQLSEGSGHSSTG